MKALRNRIKNKRAVELSNGTTEMIFLMCRGAKMRGIGQDLHLI